ncbi:alpha/beta fold hydrolase [Taibaiella koreensis]|uniref:alpha/beta fold hydrolase n=1 Tax=Taibaiella koreensis TaxID=1268548 RepID=UPI000E5998CA|nr:alpha/beta hydrolase [Taibaiella koreensis]
MTDYTISTNNIELHYVEYHPKGNPTLVLMHGLTANAHAFDGLVNHGLTRHFRLISPDLRGRGLSSKPAFRYGLEDHAQDILGLLDHLGIEKALLGGHSYGALLSVYMAAHYPERVERLVILDAAAEMNPNAPAMLGPTLSRLDKTFPSYASFLEEMKAAPQNTFWDKDMESYYKADAHIREDGTANPYPNLSNIIEVATGVAQQPWVQTFEQVMQPAVLINALDNYTMDEPLLPDFKAKETVELMHHCRYVGVDGNHQTMLYGANADRVVRAIEAFLL